MKTSKLMKKYIFTTAFALAILYSCTSQTGPVSNPSSVSKPASVGNPEVKPALNTMALAESLYKTRCEKCHDLPVVANFTETEWKPIMDAMAPKAKLTDEEKNWVLAYVNSNAKK